MLGCLVLPRGTMNGMHSRMVFPSSLLRWLADTCLFPHLDGFKTWECCLITSGVCTGAGWIVITCQICSLFGIWSEGEGDHKAALPSDKDRVAMLLAPKKDAWHAAEPQEHRMNTHAVPNACREGGQWHP